MTAESLPSSPNYYLLCPQNECMPDSQQGVSPVYSMRVKALKLMWDTMITRQARTELLAMKDNGNQRLYVQYSLFWHFPDFIHIKFVPLENDDSSYYLLSHSLFGHYDFGVNKKRLLQWQQDLKN